VGQRIAVGTLSAAVAPIAMRVFPAPVGNTMTPRFPWPSQVVSASRWYGRCGGGVHGWAVRALRCDKGSSRASPAASASALKEA
jgi:hypothetical protein